MMLLEELIIFQQMMNNKEQLGLLYMCVSDKIDSYTQKDIVKDGIVYAQLNILLSDIKKEIKKYGN
jgi:hypothetical protein